MSRSDPVQDWAQGGARSFRTTHWSVVLAAGHAADESSAAALEKLCATYWYPIYGYIRRQDWGVQDAEDLTQSFFAHLLDGHRLATVAPASGKFRSFLLASLKNFLNNERDRRQALKRGGKVSFISMDEAQGEERFQREVTQSGSPDHAFEQGWAVIMIESVLGQLRDEHLRDDRAAQFEALQPYLSGDRGGVAYSEAAAHLGLSESAVKMAVQRLRRRFGDLLRAEIAQTVATAEEVDEEIRCLFAAVSA